MSKKKLFILPVIVLVIVSIMSISVLAAGSAQNDGFKVYKNNGSSSADDITGQFTGSILTSDGGFDLSKVPDLQDKINDVNNKLKVKDFKFKTGADIDARNVTGAKPWRVYLTGAKVSSSYVAIIVHDKGGSYDVRVFKGTGDYGYIQNIQSASPFYLYVAKVSSSAQTGDYVPAYVAMISVGLLAFGAFFAIRAKKETK